MNNSKNGVNIILILMFILVAIWDVSTTFNGILTALDVRIISVVLTIFVNGSLALTFYPLEKDNYLILILGRIAWIISLITDYTTAFYGNQQLVLAKLNVPELDYIQNFLVASLAALTCIGTVGLSYILFKYNGKK